VVFIHGALHDHSGWTLLARWFAHHGHGVLAVRPARHTAQRRAAAGQRRSAGRLAAGAADAAGVRAQAALVGHSMGSLIALEAAARAPERATRLVMLGCGLPDEGQRRAAEHRARAPHKAIDMVNAFSISSLASQAQLPGAGHVAARQQPRADAQRTLAAGAATATCSSTTSRLRCLQRRRRADGPGAPARPR
jgi:pimeloyl-ACP methyl ester carboxylesterase